MRGRRSAAARVFACIVVSAIAAPSVRALTIDVHCGPGHTVRLPAGAEELRVHMDPQAQWVEVTELGQQVRVMQDGSDVLLELASPLRYGWYAHRLRPRVPLVVQRMEPDGAIGSVRLQAHCSSPDDLGVRRDWMERATTLARSIDVRGDDARVQVLIKKSEQLLEMAPDARLQAFARHLFAQVLVTNGRHADATPEFEAAEAAWAHLGDRRRALAARVARVEGEYRTGSYDKAIALATNDVPPYGDDTAYFLTRLRNTTCLSLKALGRTSAAIGCYRSTVATYRRLDERSEYALSLQTYAGALMDAGRAREAEAAVQEGMRRVTGVDVSLNRGRLLLQGGELALRRGDIAQAIGRMHDAFGEFEVAGVRRWQANSMLALADMYTRLGGLVEARTYLARAVSLLSPRDSPARIVQAILQAGDIERQAGNRQLARLLALIAEQRYEALSMRVAADGARLSAAEIAFELGEPDSTERAPDPATSQGNAVRWRLLDAEVALHQQHLDAAEKELSQIDDSHVDLHGRLRFTLLRAKLEEERGNVARAQHLLLSVAGNVSSIAAATRNPVLEYVMRRQIKPLRELGVEQILAERPPDAVERLFSWVWETSPAIDSHGFERRVDGRSAASFDAAVAEDLLTRDGHEKNTAGAEAQRELLSLLAEAGRRLPDNAVGVSSANALASLHARLDGQSAFVALIEGERHAGLLWISGEGATVVATASPDTLRASFRSLDRLLASADSPSAEISAASDRVSQLLLGGLAGRAPPRRLYMLDEGLLAAVTPAVLSWPGTHQRLLDTTATIFVHVTSGHGADTRMRSPARALVFLAGRLGFGDASLPVLRSGAREIADATTMLSEHGISVAARADGNRLIEAIEEPDAWIHVTAHGSADPGRIGYSGIWLQPDSPRDKPRFLSWVDVLGTRSRAGLVVLAACDMGAGEDALGGNPSFATSLAMSGVRWTVANKWLMSDAAAATWVPRFYSALLESEPRDIPAALRVAQQTLRESRAFRHPFYWSGLRAAGSLSIDRSRACERRARDHQCP